MTNGARMGRPPTKSFSLQMTLSEVEGKDSDLGRLIEHLQNQEKLLGSTYVRSQLRAVISKSLLNAFKNGFFTESINNFPVDANMYPHGKLDQPSQLETVTTSTESLEEVSADIIASQFGDNLAIG